MNQPTASCACVAPTVPMKSSWPSVASVAASAQAVGPGAWRRPPPTWSIRSSPGAGAPMGGLVSDPASLAVRYTSGAARARLADRPPDHCHISDPISRTPTHRSPHQRRHVDACHPWPAPCGRTSYVPFCSGQNGHPALRIGRQSQRPSALPRARWGLPHHHHRGPAGFPHGARPDRHRAAGITQPDHKAHHEVLDAQGLPRRRAGMTYLADISHSGPCGRRPAPTASRSGLGRARKY